VLWWVVHVRGSGSICVAWFTRHLSMDIEDSWVCIVDATLLNAEGVLEYYPVMFGEVQMQLYFNES